MGKYILNLKTSMSEIIYYKELDASKSLNECTYNQIDSGNNR